MKTTKASSKKQRGGNSTMKSSVRGGVVKCTASKTAPDGTTSTIEGTCKLGSAKACEEQLKEALP